jgi:hypothetical protein
MAIGFLCWMHMQEDQCITKWLASGVVDRPGAHSSRTCQQMVGSLIIGLFLTGSLHLDHQTGRGRSAP